MTDELIPDFNERPVRPDSGGEPRAVSNWADVPRLGAVVNAGPTTSLPESVSAAEILAQNKQRDPVPWGAPKETE